jgi:dihydrofolate reductase
MIISHIVAASENNVIGLDGDLPWHIPEDMKFFKDMTLNRCCIMGRKTMEALKKPLPQRLNVVITRQADFKVPGALVVESFEQALQVCEEHLDQYGDEVFVMGGGEIYRSTLNQTDRIYLTRIHQHFEGDTFYPNVPSEQFKEVDRRDRSEPIPFSFLTYERVAGSTSLEPS